MKGSGDNDMDEAEKTKSGFPEQNGRPPKAACSKQASSKSNNPILIPPNHPPDLEVEDVLDLLGAICNTLHGIAQGRLERGDRARLQL